jgi:hypothetical protein
MGSEHTVSRANAGDWARMNLDWRYLDWLRIPLTRVGMAESYFLLWCVVIGGTQAGVPSSHLSLVMGR